MNVLVSFIIVIVLVLLAIVGVQFGGLYILFGTVLPYVAIALFLGGMWGGSFILSCVPRGGIWWGC